MKTSNFETLDTGNVLVTCNEVVDHQDQAPALQELCKGINSGSVSLESAEMINDGELEFKILIAVPRKRVHAKVAAAPIPEEEDEPKKSHHKGKY